MHSWSARLTTRASASLYYGVRMRLAVQHAQVVTFRTHTLGCSSLTMSKRPLDEMENSDATSYEYEENFADGSIHRDNILSQMIRIILGRYSKNRKFKKKDIQAVLQKQKFKANSKIWLLLLDNEMRETFGLKLEINESEVVMSSNLEANSKSILYSLWTSDTGRHLSTNLLNSGFLMLHNKRESVIVNLIEQLQGGLIMIIVTILVLSGNRINELDLILALSNFGFSENLNSYVPVLNKNTPDILSDLTRKEYLKRGPFLGNDRVCVEYSLGKRALREFRPCDILNFMLEVVDLEEDQQKAKIALMRCFPEFRTDTPNTESGARGNTQQIQHGNLGDY